jgi:hypothetical protein
MRLALAQPATVELRFIEPGRPSRPVELDLVFRTERAHRSTPTMPAARSPASPHALGFMPTRTCCGRRMAAHKELASIIAAQLRHADGGAVAEQV